MWIGRDVYNTLNSLIDSAQNHRTESMVRAIELEQRAAALERENAHHLTTIDWFKLRLNAVERERSAWFAYVTGGGPKTHESIHVPPPQFAEGEPLHERMNDQFNPYGEVGEDSLNPEERIPTHIEDVSTMPRSRG